MYHALPTIVVVVLVVYLLEDTTPYYEGGGHKNLTCPELARDIKWHQDHLAELEKLKSTFD